MGTIHFCFDIYSKDIQFLSQLDTGLPFKKALEEGFESQLNQYYKMFHFLFSHPSYRFSLSIPGRQLDLFSRLHREITVVLSDLVGNKQVELLGGAYYEPLLPNILPADRVGQIELYTTALRRHTGKRPRGMVIPNNAWDPSLVTCLKTCSMDFVLMDSRLIPQYKNQFLPYIIQELGKVLYVLGQHQQHLPFDAQGRPIPPKDYLYQLEDLVFTSCHEAEHPLVCCSLSLSDFCALIDSGWLEDMEQTLKHEMTRAEFQWTLPSKYIKETQHFQRTYIPAGILTAKNLSSQETSSGTNAFPEMVVVNSYDYLLHQPRNYFLYSKMVHVSTLINNKNRKEKNSRKSARDLLWEAQSGEAYLAEPNFNSQWSHEGAYHSLLQAEHIIRDYSGFFDSVTSYDYDADGIKEYICQFPEFNAYVQGRGGSLFEYDVFRTTKNYAGSNGKNTGLFLDYFLENEFVSKNDLFTGQLYREVTFDGKRRDIKLTAKSRLGEKRQTISLRKNYYMSADGISVQYIIKNESQETFRHFFAVECNLLLDISHTSDPLDTEIIFGETDQLQVFHNEIPKENLKSVSVFRFSDKELSFVFTLNEKATLHLSENKGSLSATMVWLVDIPAQREIEKSIMFSVLPKKVINPKKKRK